MRHLLISILVSLLVTLAIVFAYHRMGQPKLGYVKTGEVLQKYEAMAQANSQYASELSLVQANLDTLRQRYERLQVQARSASRNAQLSYQLGAAEKDFTQYSQTAQQQMQQRQQQLTTEVLNQVNTFIQDYGKQQGYKIILGTTSEGSILYGLEEDDLTEIVIRELNTKYQQRKPGNEKK